MMNTAGKWALVTGATGGLGSALADQLAARGFNIVLSARGRDALDDLASKLQVKHGVEFVVEPCDLAAVDAAADLHRRLGRRGIAADILVNNAGFGLHGDFLDHSTDATDGMLRVNIQSLTELTRLFGEDMAQRGGGRILLVGSLTAYSPCPSYAAYAASKAYVVHFGEALHEELAPKGVVVTVLSPGIMNTGFLDASGHRPSALLRSTMLAPSDVALVGIKALLAGQRSVVAGRINWLAAFSSRLLPRGFQARLMGRSLRNVG